MNGSIKVRGKSSDIDDWLKTINENIHIEKFTNEYDVIVNGSYLIDDTKNDFIDPCIARSKNADSNNLLFCFKFYAWNEVNCYTYLKIAQTYHLDVRVHTFDNKNKIERIIDITNMALHDYTIHHNDYDWEVPFND